MRKSELELVNNNSAVINLQGVVLDLFGQRIPYNLRKLYPLAIESRWTVSQAVGNLPANNAQVSIKTIADRLSTTIGKLAATFLYLAVI